MKQLHLILRGTLPILQHNIRAMDFVNETPDTIPDGAAYAEACSYRLPDNSLCMPAAAVRNAILKASSGRKAVEEKSKRKVTMMPLISGSILFADDYFPLVNADGDPIKTYVTDVRSVNIKNRGRIPRHRPRIDLPWFLVCTFNYKSEVVSLEVIKELVNSAGLSIGIGDFRLEKKGAFGGFELDKISVK